MFAWSVGPAQGKGGTEQTTRSAIGQATRRWQAPTFPYRPSRRWLAGETEAPELRDGRPDQASMLSAGEV